MFCANRYSCPNSARSCARRPVRSACASPAAERWPAARSIESVVVDGQLIRVKVGAGRVKAEHDDVAAAARRTGMPFRELALRAEAAWMGEHDNDDGDDIDAGFEATEPTRLWSADRRDRWRRRPGRPGMRRHPVVSGQWRGSA